MESIYKYKIAIISIVVLIIVLLGILVFNKNINEKEKAMVPITDPVDVSDVNNISSVERNFGSPMRITHGYLLRYTVNKSGAWYMSSALIKNVSTSKDGVILTLTSDDNNYSINAIIEKDKFNLKKGEYVNFVGNVDFESKGLLLTKVSKEDIKYTNVNKIDFGDLINSIEKALSNQFIISGYMVTDNDKYKLFESKNSYNKNNGVGNYFILEWKDEFKLTGNANVNVQCYIGDTYKLINCELLK
jgi:hypothetical protein